MSKHKSEYRYKYEPVDLPKEEKKEYFRLECPSCRSKVEASDVNINDKIAKCSSCSVIFPFENKLQEFTVQNTEVERPVGVEKMYFGEDLELGIKNPFNVLAIIIFSITPLFMLISGILYFEDGHTFSGIIFAFLLFIFSYNFFRLIRPRGKKIFFIANKDNLIVEYPKGTLSKNKVFQTSEIQQLYVQKVDGYRLMAIVNTPNGQEHKTVISYLRSVSIAKFLEQELESHLGIPNKKVPNEIS